MTESELLDLVTLTLVPGVGPLTSKALFDHLGSASAVLSANSTTLKSVPGVGPKLAALLTRARQDYDARAELAWCQRAGVQLLPMSQPRYPDRLKDIPDPPALLYARGTLEPVDGLAIAIVGSRRCTPYGLRTADRLAQSLARVGLTVVSGLARGVDAAAHRGALKAGGRTIAVLANGLGRVYPPEHDELANLIAEKGAVLSELGMGEPPRAQNFPQRNRLISGISLGVVVVEAEARSGSLSTARHALEQNREVFAVPGPVDSLKSRGTHSLLKDGAALVESVDDILEQLGPIASEMKPGPTPPETPEEASPRLNVSDQERSILGLLGDRPVAVDELVGCTKLTAAQVIATLAVLEMRRLVKRVPGNLFVRS